MEHFRFSSEHLRKSAEKREKKIRRSGVSGWMKCALDADKASLDSSTEPKRTKGAMAGVVFTTCLPRSLRSNCCEPHGGVLTVGVGRLNLIKIRASGSERTEQGHVGGQWAAMKKRRKETFHILIIYRGALGCAQPKKCFSVAQICRCDLCT